MNETQIVNKALQQLLGHTAIRGTWKPGPEPLDGELHLTLQNRRVHFYAEVKNELRQHHLDALIKFAKKYQPLIVIADNIFPTLKKTLRERNINYLDTAGNIYVNAKGQYIFIDGNKPTEEKKTTTNRAFTKTGLRAVFYLLLKPDAINLPYRVLAEKTNIALGNIKNIMEGLKDAGYLLRINNARLQLQKKRELFDRWLTGYRETLQPALLLGTYRFWDKKKLMNWQELPIDPLKEKWGGEPAGEILTGYLAAAHLTVYAEPVTKLYKDWTLIPDNQGEVRIFEKFWKDEPADKERFVPPLLVYADLLLTDDPRCIETANMIYKKYLQNEFE